MNGAMVLYGYKFTKKIYLNFGKRVVFISHGEYSRGHDIFQFLQKFFNNRDFSNEYIANGLGISLNGERLHGNEYEVFYISPIVNAGEATKVLRKTLLGKLWQQLFQEKNTSLKFVSDTVDKYIVNELNVFLNNYNLQYTNDGGDVLSYCKLLEMTAIEDGIEHNLDEIAQFDIKRLLLDTVGKLETNKPKLLLLELPEYGLTARQADDFFQQIKESPIEHIILVTQTEAVLQATNNIFYYHYVTSKGVCTFEDWEEMLFDMQDYDEKAIEQYILKQLITGIKDFRLSQFVDENSR